MVRAEASRRGLRRDVRGVVDAGARLANGVRGVARAGQARIRRSRYARRRRRSCPTRPRPTRMICPVESMHYTLAEHYRSLDEPLPLDDDRQFDGDLRTLFGTPEDAPDGEVGSGVRSPASSGDRLAHLRTGPARARSPSVRSSTFCISRSAPGSCRVRRARGVDADRADGVRHRRHDELPLHRRAPMGIAPGGRRMKIVLLHTQDAVDAARRSGSSHSSKQALRNGGHEPRR